MDGLDASEGAGMGGLPGPFCPGRALMDVSQPGQQSNAADIERIYHQDPTPLGQRTDTTNLWQFPNPDQQHAKIHEMHPTGKLFYKTCDLIRHHWGVEPRDVVPEEMRAQTPYSLALLLALRRFASHSSKNFKVAQDALLTAWRQRVDTPSGLPFDQNGMQVYHTRVEDCLVGPQGCETIIEENSYGLTMEDVFTARGGGKMVSKASSKAASQPRGKLRGGSRDTQQAAAEARRLKREERHRKRALREAGVEKRQEDVLPFPASSKIKKNRERKHKDKMRDKVVGEKGFKLLQFLQGEDENVVTLNGANDVPPDPPSGANVAPPNSPELNGTQALNIPDSAVRDTKYNFRDRGGNDPAYATHANKHDRHNDQMLSQMFNRVDVDSTRSISARKERRLMAGVGKRQGSLPVDRVRLAEIPTLYTQQGFKLEAEALDALGKVKLGEGVGGREEDATYGGDGSYDGGARVQGIQGEGIVVGDDDEEL